MTLVGGQQWCCEELYQLISLKTKEGPNMIVRNLEMLSVSRGARAWYRIVREADGQIEARATELTEKLHDPNRKAVEAKDLAQAVEKLEAELREIEAITGKAPEEHSKLLALERMMPKGIRSMLQTVEIEGYKASKEYALKQARAIRNERVGSESQGAHKAGTADKVPGMDRLDHVEENEGETPDDQEALALQGKGKGKWGQGQLLQLWQTRPPSSRLLV